MKLFLKIAYLGSAYCGYQVQPNGVTVQEKLNEATQMLFGRDCDVVGCSRTDSGVHARAFCATVSFKGEHALHTSIPAEKIPVALNHCLPPDIRVRHAQFVPSEFHARYDVIAKEYEYLFDNSRYGDPFLLCRAWHIPQPIGGTALEQMQKAVAAFVGKRDFSALRDKGADTAEKDTVREVFSATVERAGELISFRVSANGFLYHMVRIMAGTLWEVARGNIHAEELPARLALAERSAMGLTAPAHGLYLDRVVYPERWGIL